MSRGVDCRALGAWAENFDRTARWTPNATGSRFGMYAHFTTPETARLFGKPVLEWTVAESRSLDAPFLDCGRVWRKGGNRNVQVKLQQLRINVVNEIPNYLTALQQARPYAERAVGSLLEFVDRTRVFVKDGGRTAAGTYTEERQLVGAGAVGCEWRGDRIERGHVESRVRELIAQGQTHFGNDVVLPPILMVELSFAAGEVVARHLFR